MMILAHNATGECVARVTALARAAGIDVEQHTDTEPLEAGVIDTILASLGIAEVEERPISGTVKGRIIDQNAWDELEARAASYTGLTVPQPQQAAPGAVQDPPAPDAETAASTGVDAAGGSNAGATLA